MRCRRGHSTFWKGQLYIAPRMRSVCTKHTTTRKDITHALKYGTDARASSLFPHFARYRRPLNRPIHPSRSIPCAGRAKNKCDDQEAVEEGAAKATVSRANYAGVFGPTTGDIVRLADTDLYVSVSFNIIRCHCCSCCYCGRRFFAIVVVIFAVVVGI